MGMNTVVPAFAATEIPIAAVLPLLIVGVAFAAYCLYDLVRAPTVRHLPKLVWGLVICLSIPLGGVVYLVAGRDR